MGASLSADEAGVVHRAVSIAAAPDWAQAPPFERPAVLPPNLIANGLCFWRADSFDDLLGPEPVRFNRVVQEIVAPDGLQGASTFDVDFDPSFERVVIHHIRVARGGDFREAAQAEAIEVFRRERDLERAKYDGRLSVHLIIPDLRVGDVIDTAFSVIGANPVFGARFCSYRRLQWGVPVLYARHRLFAPRGRAMAVRSWGPEPAHVETSLKHGNLLRAWTAEPAAAFDYEPDTPPWQIRHAQLLLTDVVSWAEVADAFRASYAVGGPLPAELDAAAARIEADEPDAKGRTAAALKLVQRELRYLAVSVGDGGFVPRSTDEIWRTRFGDCKDASRLLVALLDRLRVRAAPALVHTAIGRDLKDGPPHLPAFDHCIVRVQIEGETFWLDPTRATQGGRLERLSQARFGWALPLVEGADLQWMGEDEAEMLYEQHDRIILGSRRSSPAELQIRGVSRGWRADGLRRRVENEGLAAVAKTHADFYQNQFGRLRALQPLEVKDSEPDNEVTTTESYWLEEPWRLSDDGKSVRFSTVDETVGANLTTPHSLDRRAPIDLGVPRKALQITVVELPVAWSAQQWDEVWAVGGLTVACRAALSEGGRRLQISSRVEVRDRSLQADLAPRYFEAAEKARRSASMTLSHTIRNGEFAKVSEWRRFRSWARRNIARLIWATLLIAYFVWRMIMDTGSPPGR